MKIIAKQNFLWFKEGQEISEKDFNENPNWIDNVTIINDVKLTTSIKTETPIVIEKQEVSNNKKIKKSVK